MARTQTPEELELKRKLAEFTLLESTLGQRELDLTTFQIHLRAFESRYFTVIGRRYAELDEISLRIAEVLFAANPHNPELREKAMRARARARASAEAAGLMHGPAQKRFDPPEGLKKLYREVAKLVHPDLADDEGEKGLRQRLMAEANRAYASGDPFRLQAILYEWQSNPDTVKGEGTAAELVRVIRKIANARSRLRVIGSQMESLRKSPLHELKRRVEEREEKGKDILERMAQALDMELEAARNKLNRLTQKEAFHDR